MNATHDTPWGQKTPPLGEGPGILAESGPQRSDRSLWHSSWSAPLLDVAMVAAAAADGVDAATLAFLSAPAPDDRRKEEQEATEKMEAEKLEDEREQLEQASHRLSKRVRATPVVSQPRAAHKYWRSARPTDPGADQTRRLTFL